jgi:hypothetical protein
MSNIWTLNQMTLLLYIFFSFIKLFLLLPPTFLYITYFISYLSNIYPL